MENRKDISTMEDIKILVDTFYEKVRENELLSPIFNSKIGDRWPAHLEKMYRFANQLLQEHTYYGSPFPPHAKLPVEQQHFDTWLELWHSNIDGHFIGEKATEANGEAIKWPSCFYLRSSTTEIIPQSLCYDQSRISSGNNLCIHMDRFCLCYQLS